MAKVILLLAVLLSCAIAVTFESHDVVPYGIKEAIFTPSIRWQFKNDDGRLGFLRLAKGGAIAGPYKHRNERHWKWDGRMKTLSFIAQNGKVSTVFSEFSVDFYGAWHLQGIFKFGTGWRHYLIEQ